MELDPGVGLGALALVIGWPLVIIGGLALLGWLEAWMIQPDERAAAVQRLLTELDSAAKVEEEVARLLAAVTDQPPVMDERGVRRRPIAVGTSEAAMSRAILGG